MLDRRSFIKLLMAAPVVKCIDMIGPNDKEQMPKALIVDPYQVSMKDLQAMKDADADISSMKIIRLRRPMWGSGEAIRKVF